jgi:glycosyltransferase involved in cell wall biosynthesis
MVVAPLRTGTITLTHRGRWCRASGAAILPADGTRAGSVIEPVASPAAQDETGGAPARPELTVVLCVHNGAATIARQLDALARQRWDAPWEVLVVDNASTDDTHRIVTDFAATDPRFRVVDAPHRLGLSYARNVGAANARAPAIAFCDDDDLVGDGWVAAMGTALREHAVVACRFDWQDAAAAEPVPVAGTPVGAGFQAQRVEQMFGLPVAAGVGGWQRWLWDALGGNDESLTWTGEDFDMSIRAYLEHGVRPHFEPDAVYHVVRREGARATFRQARAYGRASVTLFARYGRERADRPAELRRALRSWLWLARHVGDVRDARRGKRWARQAGLRLGRLEQSIRSCTLWP